MKFLVALASFQFLSHVICTADILTPCSSPPEYRIIGGTDANITDVPYQAALEINGNYTCGGALISPSHVLTAAHCITTDTEEHVRLGTPLLQSGGKKISISATHVHPKYDDDDGFDYDIAILELNATVRLEETIQLVMVPEGEVVAETALNVTGWGATKGQGDESLSPHLKRVVMTVIDRRLCEKEYKDFPIAVTSRMICASAGGKGAGLGDSAAPAVTNGFVVGLFSWGTFHYDKPQIFTNIAHPEIRDFIRRYVISNP